jgi:hypothetical protein
MTGLVPRAVHVAAITAILAASALVLSAAAHAADRKPTREERQWGCSYWKPIDTQQYKECLKRNR